MGREVRTEWVQRAYNEWVRKLVDREVETKEPERNAPI